MTVGSECSMRRQNICHPFCRYYRPEKDEAEPCLAAELLEFWRRRAPEIATALEVGAEVAGRGRQAASPPDKDLWSDLAAEVCAGCVFRRHGCDFAAGKAQASPCGGFLALAFLLRTGVVTLAAVAAIRQEFQAQAYIRLAEHVSLRMLETPHLYDRLADELYEVNEAAFAWLARTDGTTPGLAGQADREFFAFLVAESLVACLASPRGRSLAWRPSPIPSLRYLELLLTERCNLRCRHCYRGEAGEVDLPLEAALATLAEFQHLQGLRVLLSGGEPLLYRHWQELHERLSEFELRFVLLTNGLLLTDALIARLQVHEVQVSLDGLAPGHDLIRGRGTWQKTVDRLEALLAADIPVSVATMVHQGNLAELPHLHAWLQQAGIREWHLDIPCVSGRLAEHGDLWVDPLEGAPYLELGFGGSDHGAAAGYACGRHLAAVLPNGTVAKCGLYADQPLGRLQEGLETCWLRLQHRRLAELACAACPVVQECRGGCRFRAGGGLAPDPVMCARYGIDPDTLSGWQS